MPTQKVQSLYVFCLLLGALLGCGRAEPEGEEASLDSRNIINGKLDFTHTQVGVLKYPGFNCTATQIGSRCLLTAAHCNADQGFFSTAPAPDEKKSRWLKIKRSTKLPNSALGQMYQDLQVVFTSKRACTGQTDPRHCSSPSPSAVPLALAPTTTALLKIVGYGMESTDPVTDRSVARNYGAMKLTGRSVSRTPGAGEMLALSMTSTNGAWAWHGDSGGPVLNSNGQLVGVMSRVARINGGLTAIGMGNGNLKWVKDRINDFCKPNPGEMDEDEMSLHVLATYEGASAPISLQPETYVLVTGGSSATSEKITVTNSRSFLLDKESPFRRLEAHFPLSVKFIGWDDWAAGVSSCPCKGSSSRVCDVSLSALSYGMGEQRYAFCRAKFQFVTGGGTVIKWY